MSVLPGPGTVNHFNPHDTQAFGTFYDRHVRMLLGYFARRTGDPHVAADLVAETFASAIVAQER